MSRDDTLRYLSTFNLDTGRLGDKISSGKQHKIYLFGDDQVVKVPRHSVYMRMYGLFRYETIVRDLNILNEFLTEFVVPTQVLRSPMNKADYVIVQQRLKDAQFLTGVNFPEVRHDLVQIVKANTKIIQQHRLSVDFFGNVGFQRSLLASLLRHKHMALMNNLLVAVENGRPRIKIADTNLSELRFHYHDDVSLFQWLVDSLVFAATRFLIRDNFDVVL